MNIKDLDDKKHVIHIRSKSEHSRIRDLFSEERPDIELCDYYSHNPYYSLHGTHASLEYWRNKGFVIIQSEYLTKETNFFII